MASHAAGKYGLTAATVQAKTPIGSEMSLSAGFRAAAGFHKTLLRSSNF
jgi:hypothetical protein